MLCPRECDVYPVVLAQEFAFLCPDSGNQDDIILPALGTIHRDNLFVEAVPLELLCDCVLLCVVRSDCVDVPGMEFLLFVILKVVQYEQKEVL